MDKRVISIAIPTYQRVEMTIEAFLNVHSDSRVSEIVIVDDHSAIEDYEALKAVTDFFPKVKLFRNETNLDCYRNKREAISKITNEWCIILDSDNIIDTAYLDTIFSLRQWDSKCAYTPEFAKPNFDFTAYSDLTVTKENVSHYIDKPMFEVCLNAANYFVNVSEYLEVWDGDKDPVTSDSIFQMYNWLRKDNKLHIVSGLQYEHRVHDGSHYKNNVNRTEAGFHESILTKLRELK